MSSTPGRLAAGKETFAMSIARALRQALFSALLLSPALPAAAVVKVACVGDSITASSTRYPTWLGTSLGSGYEVKNFGVAGTTMMKASSTPYWTTANFTSSSSYLPNLVIIMLGTNDSKTFNWSAHGPEYKPNYLEMVAHYKGLSSHPTVYVMTSPPCFNFTSSYQPEVIKNEIVPIVHQVSTETGSPLVDIFTPLTGHPELFSDGTHPTTEGSQLIASIVEGVIRNGTPTPTPRPTPTPGTGIEITPPAAAVSASTNDGNVPANTVDQSLATRWSANGDGQWIRYDLGTSRTLAYVTIAFYSGNTRRSTFDLQVSSDGASWTNVLTGASSGGTTTQEQLFDFADTSARYVRYLGHGNSLNAWNSLAEVSLFAPAVAPTPSPTPTATPTPTVGPTATPVPAGTPVEITPGAAGVAASTNDGNVPGNAVDNNLVTRWSANGDGQWLRLDLGAVRTVSYVKVAAYQGNTRRNTFDLQVSSDNATWTNVLTGAMTSGTSTAEETFDFTDRGARYVRYLGHGNSANAWNSVSEISVFGP
jgi:lysophospholipase L1-like esterase